MYDHPVLGTGDVERLRQVIGEFCSKNDPGGAKQLLASAEGLFPNDVVLHDLARLHESLGEWPDAERMWRRFLDEIEVKNWWVYTSLAAALVRNGKIEEAESLFEIGEASNPPRTAALWERLRAYVGTGDAFRFRKTLERALAENREWDFRHIIDAGLGALHFGEWEQAIDCLRIMKGMPSDVEINRYVAALKREILTRSDLLEEVDRLCGENFLMRFESLGGDYPGCEIGLVQRHYGAEPIGLLRWTTTEPQKLTSALRANLAGVGTPEQTQIYTTPGGEYKTRDLVFGMDMLTFLRTSDVTIDYVSVNAIKRISFLRNKLLRDLRENQKIFVYRSSGDLLNLEGIRELKSAMSSIGKNRLLYQRCSQPSKSVGSIEQISEELIIGYVSRFSIEPVKELFLEGWMEVFEKTAQVWPR